MLGVKIFLKIVMRHVGQGKGRSMVISASGLEVLARGRSERKQRQAGARAGVIILRIVIQRDKH